eukprot:TRINITY_DN17142_c0_g1_i1.p1 TRINITY_DN17142_c0_g1~~TRINITY_DN17142_c0_g1_i1.p1  ORF type:complete len:444 (+),score=79.37 TRINITY_DN17142_c0_g1_i1:47-1333(+)
MSSLEWLTEEANEKRPQWNASWEGLCMMLGVRKGNHTIEGTRDASGWLGGYAASKIHDKPDTIKILAAGPAAEAARERAVAIHSEKTCVVQIQGEDPTVVPPTYTQHVLLKDFGLLFLPYGRTNLNDLSKEKLSEIASLFEWKNAKTNLRNLTKKDSCRVSLLEEPNNNNNTAGVLIALLHEELKIVEIPYITLSGTYRSKGLGSLMVTVVLHEAKQRGFNVYVEASKSTLPFWKKLGFSPCEHACFEFTVLPSKAIKLVVKQCTAKAAPHPFVISLIRPRVWRVSLFSTIIGVYETIESGAMLLEGRGRCLADYALCVLLSSSRLKRSLSLLNRKQVPFREPRLGEVLRGVRCYGVVYAADGSGCFIPPLPFEALRAVVALERRGRRGRDPANQKTRFRIASPSLYFHSDEFYDDSLVVYEAQCEGP